MDEVVYILFALSAILNVFAIWYGRNLLGRMFFITENMPTLVEEILLFEQHLSSVHELEVFYGDEVLGELIRHTSGLIETLEDFAEIYTIFDEGSEDLFEEVDNGNDNTETPPKTP